MFPAADSGTLPGQPGQPTTQPEHTSSDLQFEGAQVCTDQEAADPSGSTPGAVDEPKPPTPRLLPPTKL